MGSVSKLPPTPASKLNIKRGRDAWRPPTPRPWLVENVIPSGMLGAISAYGSSLKSWILLDIALAVASGRTALGKFKTGEPKPVLYLDYENDENETGRRMNGLSPPLEKFDLCCFPDLLLTSRTLEADFTNLASQYALICIDSLGAGQAYEVDANSTKFARPLVILKKVVGRTKCAILILTHDKKKPTDRNGDEIELDKRQKILGTGATYAALDYSYSADLVSDHETDWEQIKTRWGTRLPAHRVKLEGMAPDPVTITCRTTEELKAERDRELLRKRGEPVLALLEKESPLSANDIAEKLGGNRPSRLGLVKSLAAIGLISKGDKGYSLARQEERREKDSEDWTSEHGITDAASSSVVVPLERYRKNREETES